MTIAIIGSGVSGLACAKRLAKAGCASVVFDKGRGIGGRLATRQAEAGLQFDHGAQHLPATDPGFQSCLQAAKSAGFVAEWGAPDGILRMVGAPGMTAFAKFLGQNIEICQNTEVSGLVPAAQGYEVFSDASLGTFDHVVITAPAPQTAKLVGAGIVPEPAFEVVQYDPCLTLMVALNVDADLPVIQKDPTQDIAWIALDSSKPDRATRACWVAQANAEWSKKHLELERSEICPLMLDQFLHLAKLEPTAVRHATAHRWRYAFVTNALGVPFVKSKDSALYAGGDWCLGPHVERAWLSGTAIADDLLAQGVC